MVLAVAADEDREEEGERDEDQRWTNLTRGIRYGAWLV
jgi:hypothetical protein